MASEDRAPGAVRWRGSKLSDAYNTMRELAVSERKPHRFTMGQCDVAVLPHNVAANECRGDQFTWGLVDSRSTIGDLYRKIQCKHGETLPVLEIKFDRFLPSNSTVIGELDSFGDGLIVVCLVEPTQRHQFRIRGSAKRARSISPSEQHSNKSHSSWSSRYMPPSFENVSNRSRSSNGDSQTQPTFRNTSRHNSESPVSAIESTFRQASRQTSEAQGPSATEPQRALGVIHRPTAPLETIDYQSPSASVDTATRIDNDLADELATLQSLKKAFHSLQKDRPEVVHFLERIGQLQSRAEIPRTRLLLCGDTGAGKSSLINALCEVEDLLPTSGRRACTAAAVEVSYNYDHSLGATYVGEVEFISREEWAAEISILVGDCFDEHNRLSDDARVSGSRSSISLAKIRAVYPNLPNDVLSRLNAEDIMNQPDLLKFLGKTIRIRRNDVNEMRDHMSKYIDAGNVHSGSSKDIMQLWPLVKVARYLVQAPCLSTGAVLVDLPGLQDQNSARSARLYDYMDSKAHIVIIAEAKRAVDNQTARKLLDDSFKRQTRLDGSIHRISFVCSRSDDITFTGALKAADINKFGNLSEGQLKDWGDFRILEEKEELLRETVKTTQAALDEIAASLLTKYNRLYSVDSKDTSKEDLSTIEELREKAQGLELLRDAQKSDLNGATKDKSSLRLDLCSMSVKVRNDAIKLDIKSQFGAGVRDLDLDEQPENPRNYDEISERLPVFTTSSRAFQKLSGRLKDDQLPEGFPNKASTEIPQLQCYIKALGATGKDRQFESFQKEMEGLIGSIQIWIAEEYEPVKLTAAEFDRRYDFVDRQHKTLKDQMDQEVITAKTSLSHALQVRIYHKLPCAIAAGKKSAVPTSKDWHYLSYPTYRAVVRRQGRRDPHNFNEDLTAPFIRALTSRWEACYAVDVPNIMKDLSSQLEDHVHRFHELIEKKIAQSGVGLQGISMLNRQAKSHASRFESLRHELVDIVQAAQGLMSRGMSAFIRNRLVPAYKRCAGFTGDGASQAMKKFMTDFIAKNLKIFDDLAADITRKLKCIAFDAHEKMKLCIEECCESIRRDYMLAVTPSERCAESAWQLRLLGEISSIIKGDKLLITHDEWESHNVDDQTLEDGDEYVDEAVSLLTQEQQLNNEGSNAIKVQPIAVAQPTVATYNCIPDWVRESLRVIRRRYPGVNLEAIVVEFPVDIRTNAVVGKPPTGHVWPQYVKTRGLSRIRCCDCPARVYIPGPKTSHLHGITKHLRTEMHKQNFRLRLARG